MVSIETKIDCVRIINYAIDDKTIRRLKFSFRLLYVGAYITILREFFSDYILIFLIFLLLKYFLLFANTYVYAEIRRKP